MSAATTLAALLEATRREPAHEWFSSTRLALADCLEEADDPRAEFVRGPASPLLACKLEAPHRGMKLRGFDLSVTRSDDSPWRCEVRDAAAPSGAARLAVGPVALARTWVRTSEGVAPPLALWFGPCRPGGWVTGLTAYCIWRRLDWRHRDGREVGVREHHPYLRDPAERHRASVLALLTTA